METISKNWPYVISIAGFDPSGGAGILADIKCFEQHQVYGFGICTAMTIQTDTDFFKNNWLDAQQIIDQVTPLIEKFEVKAYKIGLIKDIDVLLEVVTYLKSNKQTPKIVMDPVLKASAGYDFHDWNDGLQTLIPVLKQIDLITPNYLEMLNLGGHDEVFNTAEEWSAYCPVLLKGGHLPENVGTDYLFENGQQQHIKSSVNTVYQKHGSGCVLSSAIVAHLATGSSLSNACNSAKKYIEQFLNSNQTLLGYHNL